MTILKVINKLNLERHSGRSPGILYEIWCKPKIWILMKYYLYLLTNYKNTVLYLGVTNDLKRRVKEHKDGTNKGFSKKYKCNKLVWFEEFEDIRFAIEMEKKMKKWKREYKENLINEKNLEWKDLFEFI